MFSFGSLLLLLQAASPPANPAVPPAAANGGPPIPVCLVRSIKDAEGRDRDFPVVVTDAVSGVITGKGYAVRPCVSLGMRGARYREEICKMAAFGNEAVQNRFEQIIGVQPKELCSAAKALGPQLDAQAG